MTAFIFLFSAEGRGCYEFVRKAAAGRAFVLVCLDTAVLPQACGACNHGCCKRRATIGAACVGRVRSQYPPWAVIAELLRMLARGLQNWMP